MLTREHCSFYLASIRSKVLQKVRGGLSGLMRAILSTWFFALQKNIDLHAWLVWGSDGTVFGPTFANIGYVFGDEDARRAILRVKGSSGKAPCMWCKNVVRIGSTLAEFSDYLVDLSETNVDLFDAHSDGSFWSVCERLLGLPPNRVAQEETILGVAPDRHSLMYDVRLRQWIRPVSHT